jgi:hypothetical protein
MSCKPFCQILGHSEVVSVLSDDNIKSDDYWMGVRDALRMVDSFVRWSKRNKGKAKSLEAFIHDGLIAAAKRCQSCLKDDLGITFDDRPTEKIEETQSDPSPDWEEEFEATHPEFSDAVVTESVDILDSMPDELDLPEIEEKTSEIPDQEVEEREFESDFALVEPETHGTESSTSESESSMAEDISELYIEEIEDDVIESDVPPISIDSDLTPEHEVEEAPAKSESSFTWKDYEEAVEHEESPTDEPPKSITDEASVDTSDIDMPDTSPMPPEKPSVWSPIDEPPMPPEPPAEDDLSSGVIDDDIEEEDQSEDKSIETPPSPPPPEAEETEEERKRRARRLFFGD